MIPGIGCTPAAHGSRWKLAAEILSLMVVTGLLVWQFPSPGPRYPDEVDYWQLGQSLAEGHGFQTRMMRPLELQLHPASLFTDVTRPPLFPLLVALQQKLLGAQWFSRNPVAILSLISMAMGQWALGRALAGPWAGRVAWALAASNGTLLFYAPLLLSEITFCAMMTAVLLLWLILPPGRWSAAAVGAGLGCAFLTRAVAILYVPAFLILTWRRPGRQGRDIGLLMGGAVAVSLPWLVRNWIVLGTPMLGFNSLQLPMFTERWPGYSLYRAVEPVDPVSFALAYPAQLLAKWKEGIWMGLRAIPAQAGVVPLLLTCAAALRSTDRLQRCSRLALITVAGFLAVLPLYEPRDRHYVPLVVGIIPVAAAMLTRMTKPQVCVALLVLLVGEGIYWQRQIPPPPPPITWAAGAVKALNALPEEAIVATDAPWVVALATPHRALWIPQDEQAWRECRQRLPDLEAAFVTPGLQKWSSSQRPRWWSELLVSGGLLEGQTPQSFNDGSRLWVLADTG